MPPVRRTDEEHVELATVVLIGEALQLALQSACRFKLRCTLGAQAAPSQSGSGSGASHTTFLPSSRFSTRASITGFALSWRPRAPSFGRQHRWQSR